MIGSRPASSVRPKSHSMKRYAAACGTPYSAAESAPSSHVTPPATRSTRNQISRFGERNRIQQPSATSGASKSVVFSRSAPLATPRWMRTWYAMMPATASTFHARPAARTILRRPVRLEVVAETPQRAEDPRVVLVVRAELDAVCLRDRERDLEHIDGIEPEALAVQRRRRAYFFGLNVQLERRDDESRELELLGGNSVSLRSALCGDDAHVPSPWPAWFFGAIIRVVNCPAAG